MKKSVILGILGLSIVGTLSSFGQGAIFLDNYVSSTYNPVVFSAGLGSGLVGAGFTVGIFYDTTANQNIASAVNSAEAGDSSGSALITSFGALTAASGSFSSVSLPVNGGSPGYFSAAGSFLIQPSSAVPAQSSYTMVLVAFNGADYASSTERGYSLAEYITDATPSTADGADLGNFWTASSPLITVNSVPEPTTLALAGMGAAALLAIRRKKA